MTSEDGETFLTRSEYCRDFWIRLVRFIFPPFFTVIDEEELNNFTTKVFRGERCQRLHVILYVFFTFLYKYGFVLAWGVFIVWYVLLPVRDIDGAFKYDFGSTETDINIRGVAIDLNALEVYDASDLVTNFGDSAFIMTSYTRIPQVRGICDDVVTKCKASLACPSSKPTPTGDGYFTGKCNFATGMCRKRAWCPVKTAKDAYPKVNITDIGSLAVDIALYTRFPIFNETVDSKINFTIDQIVISTDQLNNETNMSITDPVGILTIALNTQWFCDRGIFKTESNCNITFTFLNMSSGATTSAEPKAKTLSHQDKVVTANYYQGPNGIMMRNLTMANGILLTTVVDSYLYQFYFVNMLQAIGSYLSYFDIAAPIAVSFFAFACCARRRKKLLKTTPKHPLLCKEKSYEEIESVSPV